MDAEKGGILTLNNASSISLSGVNFLKEDYTDKIYFLAAADEILVNKGGVTGAASDFDTRVISLGYGYYGLISTIDGHGTVIGGNDTTYGTDHAANVWTAAKEEHYADYLAATVTLTDADTRINTTLTKVQNVVKNDVLIQVAKADRLAQTDVGGKGLTLGLSQETLEKATAAGVRYLALQVSNSGRFLYEQQAVLESVKLTKHNGTTYVNPAYDYKVVSSKDVADFLGVAPSEVSDTLLYIEVSEMPEPTSTTLSLLALAALASRRRRR